MRVAPFLLLFIGFTAVPRAQEVAAPVWTVTLPDSEHIVQTAWSPSASCVAAATATTIRVFDVEGRALWQWNVSETSAFLHLSPLSEFALSPACDAVVLNGDPGYKYVWLAERRGTRRFFKTTGTPLASKFDLRGDTIAVVTGASRAYLMSPRLEVKWSGPLRDLPIRWPAEVVDDVSAVIFARDDVEALFGAMLWGRSVWDSVSDDGQWRAVWQEIERGPTMTFVELWGPGAGGYRGRYGAVGRPRWVKPMGCPLAELTRDGMFVIASGDPEHPNASGVGDSVACDSGQLSTYVFDRDGDVVLTLPPGQPLEGLAAAVLARTGYPMELQSGNWDVPLTPEEARSSPDTRRRLAYGPGRTLLLVGWTHELRLYRAPN